MAAEPKILVVLAGISGSGKTFLTSALARDRGFAVIPSLTTRAPREGEVNSTDRRFCTRPEFDLLRERQRVICGRFFFGNWYGHDTDTIDAACTRGPAVLQLTYKSVGIFQERYPEAKAVYILPPSLQAAKDAVIARNLKQEETAERLREIDDESIFISEDRRKPTPMFNVYFENARSPATIRDFLGLIDQLRQ